MQGLQKLNIDGCGICKKADWSKMQNPTLWERIKNRVALIFRKKVVQELKPWCTVHKKYVERMHRCIQYSPKKQITIFGAAQDENIEITAQDLRGNYVKM